MAQIGCDAGLSETYPVLFTCSQETLRYQHSLLLSIPPECVHLRAGGTYWPQIGIVPAELSLWEGSIRRLPKNIRLVRSLDNARLLNPRFLDLRASRLQLEGSYDQFQRCRTNRSSS